MQHNPPIPDQPDARSQAVPAERTEASTAIAAQAPAPRWISFLYIVGVLLELIAMLVMTWMRYRNQGLSPHFFAWTKSANLLGLLITFPFIAAFVTATFLPRLHRRVPAFTTVALSGIGLFLLFVVQYIVPEDRPLAAVIYLAFKGVFLAILIVTFSPAPRPLWRKMVYVAIFSLLLITASYTVVIATVLFNPVTSPSTDAQPRAEYDAGVILGAAVWSGNKPSPVFRERIRKGYELLKNGTVEFLVLTGGNAPHELPEAEVAKRELLRLGADPTRIVLEEHTSSTAEQILFIRDELTKQGWRSFVIISDQFHLKRALEICAFNNIEANGISSESPLGPYNLAIYHLRESAALILYWLFGL